MTVLHSIYSLQEDLIRSPMKVLILQTAEACEACNKVGGILAACGMLALYSECSSLSKPVGQGRHPCSAQGSARSSQNQDWRCRPWTTAMSHFMQLHAVWFAPITSKFIRSMGCRFSRCDNDGLQLSQLRSRSFNMLSSDAAPTQNRVSRQYVDIRAGCWHII